MVKGECRNRIFWYVFDNAENGKWSIEDIGSLSSRIIKWEIKELYLQNNFSKTILQQI